MPEGFIAPLDPVEAVIPYCICHVAVTVAAEFIVITAVGLVEVELPDQATNTYWVPGEPATVVGLIEKAAAVPALYQSCPLVVP